MNKLEKNIRNGEFILELQHILDTINNYETIIINRHVRPDPDAIGSQVALKKILQLSFQDKQIYAEVKEVLKLDFLIKMDEVEDATFEHALVIVSDTSNSVIICIERYDYGE